MHENEYICIHNTIDRAVSNGSFSCNYPRISYAIKARLEAEGYRIENFSDQREQTDYYIIKW